jgi:hypothetical protein
MTTYGNSFTRLHKPTFGFHFKTACHGGNLLKGQCHEIFDFWFFSWISFPQAPEYTMRVVSNFFENSRRYSQLKVHHRCGWHWWQIEKSSIIKVLIILFRHLWEVELTYTYIFAFKFTLRSQQPDIAQLVAKFATGVVDTGGNFANFPPVSLITVVHLDLQISPWIFEKIRKGPNGILWGWGETDSWKKPEAKNLVTLSL